MIVQIWEWLIGWAHGGVDGVVQRRSSISLSCEEKSMCREWWNDLRGISKMGSTWRLSIKSALVRQNIPESGESRWINDSVRRGTRDPFQCRRCLWYLCVQFDIRIWRACISLQLVQCLSMFRFNDWIKKRLRNLQLITEITNWFMITVRYDITYTNICGSDVADKIVTPSQLKSDLEFVMSRFNCVNEKIINKIKTWIDYYYMTRNIISFRKKFH